MISNEGHQGNVVTLSTYPLDQAYQRLLSEKEVNWNENNKEQDSQERRVQG